VDLPFVRLTYRLEWIRTGVRSRRVEYNEGNTIQKGWFGEAEYCPRVKDELRRVERSGGPCFRGYGKAPWKPCASERVESSAPSSKPAGGARYGEKQALVSNA